MGDTILKALKLMGMGMVAIFVVMIVLYGVVSFLLSVTKKRRYSKNEDDLKTIAKKSKNTTIEVKSFQGNEKTGEDEQVLNSTDDEETVAAIMSAITVMLGTRDFEVRNINRVAKLDSLWAQAGRMQLMK